jgi:hypothetical protein
MAAELPPSLFKTTGSLASLWRLMRWQAPSLACKVKSGTVTPRVSKPHDYANHMFMRLSVDQIRNLESNLKFAISGVVWTIRLGWGFFMITLDRVSLHFQKRICS